MKKRILSIILAVLMVLALLPFGALAANQNDLSVFVETLKQKLDQISPPVFGTFFDLDQDGTLEMILTGSGQIYICTSTGTGISRSYSFPGSADRNDSGLIIVQYPDGSFGLLIHSVGYGEYAGSDDEGYDYYWTDTSDICYKVSDGDIRQDFYMDAHVLQTRPDVNGNIHYVPDGMSFSVKGQPATEAQYDNAYLAWIDPLEFVMVLSPFRQLDGLTGQQMLSVAQVGFYDVPTDMWYADAVKWAAENGVTNGTAPFVFSPDSACTRGQVVTFLWRAAGSPEPESEENPFVDVTPMDYYYKAVLWAVEQGITNGMDPIYFGPDVACTRAHVVTFLWRWHNKPAAEGGNPFVDVHADDYYYNAVLWAVSTGVTNGTGVITFSPDDTCTRGQIVTFLYRDLAK